MSDFFVSKEEKVKEKENKIKQEEKQNFIPKEFLKIKLSTLGKLDAPYVLHIRNYSMQNAIDLSLMSEEDALETTVGVLNKMIYEDFDASKLHKEELKEILINIYGNFWSPNLENFPYPLTSEDEKDIENLPKEHKLKIKKSLQEGNYPKVNIPIKSIKTEIIKDEFKEPITISNNDICIKFRLNRVGDMIKAKNYVLKKYMKEEQLYADTHKLIKQGKEHEVEFEDLVAYKDWQKKKVKDLAIIAQALLILEVNGKKLDNLEEKIKYIVEDKIPINIWKEYNKIIENYTNFGINPEIEVKSPYTGDNVIRRFQFRYIDFIKNLESQNDSGYTIRFGD